MSVLLPNATLGLRRQVWDNTARNAHGERLSGNWEPATALYGGRTNERADGGWSLAVDAALWPIKQGDMIVSDTGAAWIVNTADLIQNNYDHTVDWVRIDGYERETSGGTEPGGPQFVGRD